MSFRVMGMFASGNITDLYKKMLKRHYFFFAHIWPKSTTKVVDLVVYNFSNCRKNLNTY